MNSEDKQIRFLLAALITAFAPQMFLLPPWIVSWVFVLWGYAFLAERKGWPVPGPLLRGLMAGAGILGVLLSSGGVMRDGAYVGLLAIMSGLKVLEVENHRDRMVTVFLAYFLVITSLFQAETLGMTLYMFFSTAVTTAVLIHINRREEGFGRDLWLSFAIMLKAAPIMAVLFFLFPRVEGSLWGVFRGPSAVSGFGDEMYPGSVSSLVENDEVAFRVRFEGRTPSRESLYWRGIVFRSFDGYGWRPGAAVDAKTTLVEGSSPWRYTVMLEPHRKKHLFALDMPVAAPPGAVILEDGVIYSRRTIRRLHRYRAKSHIQYHAESTPTQRREALRLPPGGNPRSRALALGWKENLRDPGRIVETGMKYFEQNDFVYTLNPARLHRDPVDRFLFETREGYCEHFASAFAFLMRAAGVPARVVGGYQGGEKNPYADYLIVRQSDAHAWVEVDLPGKGWVRADPTARVSPERIRGGVRQALNPDELPDFLTLEKFGAMAGFWNKARFSWDAVNSLWDVWFVGYSHLEQRDILESIGFESGSWREAAKMTASLAALIAAWFGFATLRACLAGRRKADPVKRTYDRFCRKMAAAGLERKPGQGPLDFARQVAAQSKQLAEPVEKITETYVRLRYGHLPDETGKRMFKTFEKQVKNFNPRIFSGK